MIYIKLSQSPKTLAIALTLAGAYCHIPLPNADSLAQAQSSIADVSKSTPTHPLTSRVLMPGQVVAKSLLNNSNMLAQPQPYPGVQVAQSEDEPTNRGAPDDTPGAGTWAVPAPPNRGAPDDRPGAGTRAFPPALRLGAFTAPPNRGAPAPGQRQGAGSRGPCPDVAKPLTALVPIIQGTSNGGNSPTPEITTSDSVLGLTVAEHPTFWFYMPYSLNSSPAAISVEFVLQDENSNQAYKTVLTTSENSPGVYSFELPSTAPPLEVGRRYHWYFVIYCGNSELPNYVEGWVERVELNPSLKTQLEQATPLQRVALYAKAGIWHEAVTSLGKLRRENPKNAALMADWNELLKSVDLEAIAQEPIQSVFSPPVQ